MRYRSVSIAHTLQTLAVIIITIFAVIVPAGYFIISYQYVLGNMKIEIELSARDIEELIVKNPHSWHYEEIRLQEVLQRRIDHDSNESRTILDLNGYVIVKEPSEVNRPMLRHIESVYDSGIPVAFIEVRRSLRPLVFKTALLGAISCILALGIFLVFRYFPLRIIRDAYSSLEKNEQRLNLAISAGRFGIGISPQMRSHTTRDSRSFMVLRAR